MSLLKYLTRISYVDFMVRRKATGNLDAFSQKIGLSKRTLTDVLHEMREIGFPIKYDRMRGTYYYTEEGQMIKCLFFKYGEVLSRDKVEQIGKAEDLYFSKKPSVTYVKKKR